MTDEERNTPESDAKLREYSLEEIKSHNNEEDKWLILHGRVYDVTKFLDAHPGGPDTILDVTAEEATIEFEGLFHSSKARDMAKKYLIGKVKGAKLGDLHKTNEKTDKQSSSKMIYYIPFAVAVGCLILLTIKR